MTSLEPEFGAVFQVVSELLLSDFDCTQLVFEVELHRIVHTMSQLKHSLCAQVIPNSIEGLCV